MKNTIIERHLAPESLAGKRGKERAYAKLVAKAPPYSDFPRVKTEEFHSPCLDAVHRFGKRSGST
jgi:hypothetical protein